jgi:hypothetical protein
MSEVYKYDIPMEPSNTYNFTLYLWYGYEQEKFHTSITVVTFTTIQDMLSRVGGLNSALGSLAVLLTSVHIHKRYNRSVAKVVRDQYGDVNK